MDTDQWLDLLRDVKDFISTHTVREFMNGNLYCGECKMVQDESLDYFPHDPDCTVGHLVDRINQAIESRLEVAKILDELTMPVIKMGGIIGMVDNENG